MFRRRSLWVVLSLALLVSVAVGAFAVQGFGGGPRPIVVPSVESGSLAHFDAADAAAAAWRPDAALVSLHATEGKPLEGRVDPPLLYDTSPDPVVGNGLAVAWTFAYLSQSEPGRMFYVTLGGDGSVLYQRALADPSYGCCYAVHAERSTSSHSSGSTSVSSETYAPPVLLRPTLDAADAFARVADRPEFAEFAADHPVFQAYLQLVHGPDNTPTWAIGYRTATYYSSSALVDARDGDVLEVFSWPQPPTPCCDPIEGPVPPQPDPCCRPQDFHDVFETTLGPSRPAYAVRIPVDSLGYAREMRVAVSIAQGLPTADDVVVRLVDNEGRGLAYERGQGPFELVVTDFPSQGIYTLMLQLPTPLRDVPVKVAADVVYGDEVRPAPAEYVFRDATYGWGGQTYVPLWFQDMAQPVRLTLRWEALAGLDGMELVLLDSYGNEREVVRAQGASATGGHSEAVLDLPVGEPCCMTAIVRNPSRLIQEQPFELVVEVVDGHQDMRGYYAMH